MSKNRLIYKKEGKASYISHLDLMRTFQRAFLRAGLKIKHTEGFNPHAYISVALPLSVGAESQCELLDFELQSECPLNQVPEKLNEVMPEGITVIKAYEAERKIKEIEWLDIEGVFEYDRGESNEIVEKLIKFFSQESVVILKKGKKGKVREVDIIPCINNICFSSEGDIKMRAILAAQNPSLNPELLIEALRQKNESLVPDFAVFRRIEVLDGSLKPFR